MANKICEDAISRQLEKIQRIHGEAMESLEKQEYANKDFFSYELTTLKPLIKETRDGLLSPAQFSSAASEMLRKLNAVARRTSKPQWFARFGRTVDDLRKMLLVRDQSDRSVLFSALAIQDAADELQEKMEKLIAAEKWEHLEFARTEKSTTEARQYRRITKKKASTAAADSAEQETAESEPTFGDLLHHLMAAGRVVFGKADDLADDMLGCTDCEDLHEDCEELEEALSELRCLFCDILCEVDFQDGGEQPASLWDLKADLADIGVSIELALWEFDKICLRKKSYSERLQPVLAKVSTGVQAIQSAITSWAGERLDSGPVYTAATSDISAQLQELANAVSRLGPSTACDSLRSLLPLVDGVSQSLRGLYCKKLDGLDKRVFLQPWSLLVQIRCILEPCCEEEDECDDLKKQLSRFFCLWQDLSVRFKDVNCEEAFEKEANCCCTTSASASLAASLSTPQVNAALQQFQQVVAQARAQSLLSQDQVDSLNKILPAPSGAGLAQTAAARLTLARYGGALSVLLAQAADQAAKRCVCEPSAQQGQLATLQYQLGQAMQMVQRNN